jgi:hypothetical protein
VRGALNLVFLAIDVAGVLGRNLHLLDHRRALVAKHVWRHIVLT